MQWLLRWRLVNLLVYFCHSLPDSCFPAEFELQQAIPLNRRSANGF